MRHQTPLTLSSTLRNRLDSPLLRLPAELRNKIYGYVLTQEAIRVAGPWGCDTCTRPLWVQHAHYPRHILNILEVCQQTYTEGRLLVFSLNQHVGDHLAIHEHVDKILTAEQRSALKEVHLEILNSRPFGCGNKLSIHGLMTSSLRPVLRYVSGLSGLRKIVLVHVYACAHHRLCPSDVANLKWKLAEDIQGKAEVEFVQRLTTYS
jgi:hypothetical protein